MTQPVSPIPERERTGIMFGLLAMTLFSCGDGIWKYCLKFVSMPVVFCISFAVAALSLIVFAGLKRKSLRPANFRHVAILTAFFTAEQLTFVYALGRVPMAELFVVILTTPLAVLISAHFLLHERLSGLQIASVVSGFTGALLVVLTRVAGLAPVAALPEIHNAAILVALANIIINSGKILFLRRLCQNENGYAMALSTSLTLALLAAIPAGATLFQTPPAIFFWLCLSGCLSTLGFLAYVAATQKARAPLMAATQYSQIIWAALIGSLVFNEPLSAATWAGAGLIILSGVFLYGRFRSASRQT